MAKASPFSTIISAINGGVIIFSVLFKERLSLTCKIIEVIKAMRKVGTESFARFSRDENEEILELNNNLQLKISSFNVQIFFI
jgi:hypothetical protein